MMLSLGNDSCYNPLSQLLQKTLEILFVVEQKVNFGQNLETLGPHFCSNMKLRTHPAIHEPLNPISYRGQGGKEPE